MGLSIAFFGLTVTFAAIGSASLKQSKQLTEADEANTAKSKKMKTAGVLHLVSAGLLFIAGILWLVGNASR